MNALRILVLLALAFLFGNCVSTRGFKSPSFLGPMQVAVLPLNNMSNDLKAAEMFRELFKNSLQDMGYSVAKNGDVDFLLQRNGFTDGGQLTNIPPEKLCAMLGIDAVFIGTLEKASQLTTGVYNKKQVRAGMKLYRGSTLLWADETEAKKSTMGLSGQAIGDAFVQRLAGKALVKFNGHPLLVLTEQVIMDLQQRLPGKRIMPTGWEPRDGTIAAPGAPAPNSLKRAK